MSVQVGVFVTHAPFTQLSLEKQKSHVPPSLPHAARFVPGWHSAPVCPPKHPPTQLPPVHAPPLHVAPLVHCLHVRPPWPHAVLSTVPASLHAPP